MPSLRFPDSTNLRSGLIHLCAKIQGKKVYLLRSDYKDAFKILKYSDAKGSFIERLHTSYAWEPLLSLEALDGPEWSLAQGHFRRILTKSNWKSRLDNIIDMHCVAKITQAKNSDLVLTSKDIRQLICGIMFELVFKKKPMDSVLDLFCHASVEWSKELAMRGKGNRSIKSQFMRAITALVEENDMFPKGALDSRQILLFTSAIAQPLFISPLINFADIFSAVAGKVSREPHWYDRVRSAAATHDTNFINHFVLECVRLQHPFPVLERKMIRDIHISTGTLEKESQVIVLIDEFEQDQSFCPSRWQDPETPLKAFIFGAGPRGCLGQQLAEKIFTQVTLKLSELELQQNCWHMSTSFSGRENDSVYVPGEVKHQLKTAFRMLITSYNISR